MQLDSALCRAPPRCMSLSLAVGCWMTATAGDRPEACQASVPAFKSPLFNHSLSDPPLIHVVLVAPARCLRIMLCVTLCDSVRFDPLLLLTSISSASRMTCSTALQASTHSGPAPQRNFNSSPSHKNPKHRSLCLVLEPLLLTNTMTILLFFSNMLR